MLRIHTGGYDNRLDKATPCTLDTVPASKLPATQLVWFRVPTINSLGGDGLTNSCIVACLLTKLGSAFFAASSRAFIFSALTYEYQESFV